MLGRHTFNLSRWLDRLGIRGDEVPPVIPLVQPVQVVGDASLLVPPLLPPCAAFGGDIPGVALQYGAVECQSRAPGGCLIRLFRITTNANAAYTWRVGSAPLTFAASAPMVAQNFGIGTVVSTVTQGTLAVGNLIDYLVNPTQWCGNRATFDLSDTIYLAPGEYFAACGDTANQSIALQVVLQDLTASPGSE